MEIIFTKHARYRIEKRKILEGEVIDAINITFRKTWEEASLKFHVKKQKEL